jgi:hypothetical protein
MDRKRAGKRRNAERKEVECKCADGDEGALRRLLKARAKR